MHLCKQLVSLLRTAPVTGKYTYVYFQPNERFADSMVRAYRKGRGLFGLQAPLATDVIQSVDISIVGRPGVFAESWLGYTVSITDVEHAPRIVSVVAWLESGGMEQASADTAAKILPMLNELLGLPATNVEPRREAPESMF
jgi:hypothetical protein